MRKVFGVLVFAFSLIYSLKTFAHCEIPCGIYHDELRISQIQESILTIEKSIRAIQELSKEKENPLAINQLVRWIDNKDKHAEKIQYIIWQYFFTQRVKPVDSKNHEKYEQYLKKLELLNRLNFYAMKAKQSVDLKVVDKLRETLEEFEEIYFGKENKEKHHH
ncbi:MAG TPA: superoxide dismutase [Persephonella sp.]|nr:superoxide dismutase [Hydrogenothermaceae bacterium]HIQ24644.1 superoxide dismutase [Persephonella sp.]